MSNWSLDILRQSGWDVWLLVCLLATLTLVGYAIVARPWQTMLGAGLAVLIGLVAIGTGAILASSRLQNAVVGLIWTMLVLTVVSAAFYSRLLPQLGVRRTLALLSLRFLTLLLLVPMLFEPVLRFVTRPRPEKPLIFLIDASGSMSFPDVQNGPTRLQSVYQVLRPQLERISEHFVPRYYTFATEATRLDKPEELSRVTPDGKATDIVRSVTGALGGEVRPDAAVILISDGIDNVSPSAADSLRAFPRPIHTVRVGSEQAEPAALANVAIDNIDTSEDFVVNHETKVKVTVKSSALANRVVEVKLAELDAQGRPAGNPASKTLVLQPLPEGQIAEIPFRPRSVGVQRLAIWIDPIAGERSTVDNRQEFQGLALDPRIKVLYIEGRVRPEYTQLNRALARDPNIEVATLLRITQERFATAGTIDGKAIDRIPVTADEWKGIDVVILGDMDSSFLNRVQQAAIEQFVLRGGGLLMIGGQNNFGPGGYKDSPIEKALPVFVGEVSSPQERTPFVPKITLDGQTHPAMEGLAEWFSGEAGESTSAATRPALPPLRGNVVVAKPKSGAQVLLTHADRPGPDGQPQIVLAAQRYGEGRSAAFTADTTFLWYLPLRGMGQDSPYNRFWGQLIRWLANSDVRNRQRGPGVDGLLSKSTYQLGESVKVRAMVRDERGDATRYAQVNLLLRKADGSDTRQLPLNTVETRTGLYDVTIPSPDKGDWTVELSAAKEGRTLGKQSLKFTVIPPAEEMLKLAANPALLRAIAQNTKGFHCELAQLPSLIDQLIRAETSKTTARQVTVPLASAFRTFLALFRAYPDWPAKYDFPIQAFLILVLLTGEWLLRRQWQLP